MLKLDIKTTRGIAKMKSIKQNLFDLLMYSIFLVFFIFWFLKDDTPAVYLWTVIILYVAIIAFKIKKIFFVKES